MQKKRFGPLPLLLFGFAIIGGIAFLILNQRENSEDLERKRQELLQAELAKQKINIITTSLSGDLHLSSQEAQMVRHIRNAGTLLTKLHRDMQGVLQYHFMIQENGNELEKRVEEHNQHPWCNLIEDPLCNALSIDARKTTTYPTLFLKEDGMPNCELVSEMEGISPFMIPVERDGKPALITFAEAHKEWLIPAAAELRKAATIADKINERPLAKYMRAVAEAFETKTNFPYAKSDDVWQHELPGRSKFFLRIGADETGWEECGKFAGYHLTLGMIDTKAAKQVERYKTRVIPMEEELVRVIGIDAYPGRDVTVQMPEFVRIVEMSGDARHANAQIIGQTLPNQCGPDGLGECHRRTMIYTNHIVLGYSEEGGKPPRISEIVIPETMAHYAEEAATEKTVLHEFAHNFGPQGASTRPGATKTLDEELKDDARFIEEFKAEIAAIHYINFNRGSLYNDTQVKSYATQSLLWCLNTMKKGLMHKDDFSKNKSPYVRFSAIITGWFLEQGAFTYDKTTRLWGVNFERFPEAAEALLQKVGHLYATADVGGIQAMTDEYLKGSKLTQLHLDELEEKTKDHPIKSIEYVVTK